MRLFSPYQPTPQPDSSRTAAPNSPPNSVPSPTAHPSPSASDTITMSASRFLPVSDFSYPAAKANASWPQLSSTTNFHIVPQPTAPCCAVSSPDQTLKTSVTSPMTLSPPLFATNCSRSSSSAPGLSSAAS